MKFTNFNPISNGVKSFYGKAKLAISDTGEIFLKSYDTIILSLTPTNDGFTVNRIWGGYSVTTMRHINDFLALHGINQGGKKWWDSLPVTKTA